MFSLEGKTALVTGGTSGIGLMVGKRFIAAGARVCVVGRRDTGHEIARKIGAHFLQHDVSEETAVVAILQNAEQLLGKLDILVLNAGDGSLGAPLADTSSDLMQQVFQVNTFGTFFGLKHGPAHMHDKGSIICTSSSATGYRPPLFEPYASSKAAIDSLVRSAAMELGPRGIRVNAVCPGGVATEMAPYDAELDRRFGQLNALGRGFMTEREIVGVYHFLASEEASFITGQAVAVDGGSGLGCSLSLYGLIAESGHS
jgi:NAD(P)-dependent dehydrogenase (short-subunit alcohol dehydrogenase family)